MSEVNCIISILINGPTHRIILSQRKLGVTPFFTNDKSNQSSNQLLSQIWEYSVASTENAAFIIGGRDQNSEEIDIIAKFQDNEWTRYGSLNTARYVHGSITSADQTMIVGGFSAS